MSAARDRGTRWETLIVEYLRESGALHAERRALQGALDRGDIAGIPGVVIEAKNAKAITLGPWLNEALAEKANDHADVGVVWHHRRGKGSPRDAYVTMTGSDFVWLLKVAGYIKGSTASLMEDDR